MFFGTKKDKDFNIQDIKILYTKRNYKAALSKCKKYLEKHNNDFDATNLLGDIYYELGDKTKALEIYKNLADLMEEDKYLDKSIALTKKVIRLFPEQYDLYRKLAKLFTKKNLKAEQLSILYELADIYEKQGLNDKTIDIFKEIAEIDRQNIESYKKIVKKLYDFGKKNDVCKFMYYCLELSHNNKDFEALNYFCKIAIDCNYNFKDSLKFATNFFDKHDEYKEIFIKYAIEYLSKDFDNAVFALYAKYVPYEKEKDFYNMIKDKYRKYEIYSFILSSLDAADEKFKFLIEEIINLPEYEFNLELTNLCNDCYKKVNDPETLDLLLILASKGDLKEVQINIYEKLAQIYKDRNEFDKAESIEKYINDLKYSDFTEIKESGKSSYNDIVNTESIPDLEIDTHAYEDIDLSLDNFDTDLDKSEIHEINLENPFELNITEDEKREGESEIKNFDIEINLDDFEISEDIKEEKKDDGDAYTDINIDMDIDIDMDMDLSFPSADTPLEKEIAEIETLISSGSINEAKSKLDAALIKYPDDEKLKDIATSLIFLETEMPFEEEVEVKNITKNIKNNFSKIAESIKQSINEQVSEDDYETHFDLANAYMEMELYEDAILELKKSATGKKKYESLYLMGECYKRVGEYDNAINIHKLIVVEYEEKDKLLNSLYEIGLILESMGDNKAAQEYFEKVYNIDPEFRDIKEKYRHKEVKSRNNRKYLSEDDGGKEKNKKRISFL